MSKTDSLHYKLCCEGAKWLHKNMIQERDGSWVGTCKIVAVELVTAGAENPDVWGLAGGNSAVIEVKTSRSDFLHDKKKLCRKMENYSCGNYRYYLVPEGLVSEEEIPEKWGLLYWTGTEVKLTRRPVFIHCANFGDLCMLSSIARREGVKNKIYNYR